MSYQKEWLLLEANDEIDEMEHRNPSEEYQFYHAVASGNVDYVRRNCESGRFSQEEGVGQLSRDPVLNLKYHLVITTAMITRLCVQSGMELEQAFRLSDFYIQKLDDLHSVNAVCQLHDDMVMDFTKKMRKHLRNDTNSKHINAGKEYIYAHIKERITIEDLADSGYIRQQKINMAKNLLRFSDSSMIDIANQLAFSSQSHFIQQFREVTGMTPKKYRDVSRLNPWED